MNWQAMELVFSLVTAFSLGFIACCSIFLRRYRKLKKSVDETNAYAKEMWSYYNRDKEGARE